MRRSVQGFVFCFLLLLRHARVYPGHPRLSFTEPGRGWPGHFARRRASRFCPAMTIFFTISRRHQRKASAAIEVSFPPRRIVEEPLAKNLFAAPLLQCDF